MGACYVLSESAARRISQSSARNVTSPTREQKQWFLFDTTKMPNGNVWYAQIPVRCNTLHAIIKTNHSLGVTTATRQTGLEGIRTYKRVGKDQKKTILNVAPNDEELCRGKPRLKQPYATRHQAIERASH